MYTCIFCVLVDFADREGFVYGNSKSNGFVNYDVSADVVTVMAFLKKTASSLKHRIACNFSHSVI